MRRRRKSRTVRTLHDNVGLGWTWACIIQDDMHGFWLRVVRPHLAHSTCCWTDIVHRV